MKRALNVALAALAVAVGLPAADAKPRLDYARVALNILPPGQSGSLSLPPTTTDQLALYDRLTPKFDAVTARDLTRDFKDAHFGVRGRVVRTERPRRGVRILRDSWGVPHVYGRTRDDVVFGAGWATAADRGLLMNLFRGPGRIAAVDAPGLNAFALASAGRQFLPSAQTEAFVAQQVGLLRRQPGGARILRDVQQYVAGINAYNRAANIQATPWTANDVVAVAALIGAVFGAGGGDETRNSMFLDALRTRFGPGPGEAVFADLRQLDDAESPVSVPRRVAYDTDGKGGGDTAIDDGSFVPWRRASAPAAPRTMSNALLIGRSRSQSGRPLFVAGPQTGHSFPQNLMELDLHGGGFDVRGAAFPGISMYVLLGRGRDYAWSATSANGDIVDEYAEDLCGDDLHYRFQGECRAMTEFDAGTLVGAVGEPDERIRFRETVHGPVIGYATIRAGSGAGARRVAVSVKRSTRGREVLSARFFADMSTNRPRSAREFLTSANKLELTFNLLYADDRDIAQFTSGRLPIRARSDDPGLPTLGTGEHEWRGFLGLGGHPWTINPPGGTIVNWNNRPARGFAASDDNWSWGSVQRVEMLQRGVDARRKHTLSTVVAAMNRAATQDIRTVEVWPVIRDVLGASGGTARAERMASLLDDWRTQGSSRLDRDLDGRIDHPGAAIMDAVWRPLADAVMAPVLGPLTERLGALEPWSDRPRNGNAYGSGWYGYVDKDLRTLLGRTVAGPYSRRYCGAGEPVACRASLWAALEEAGAALERAQGPDPAAWRADATAERTGFGLLPRTMRFANRPTFQQVITFDGHRPRPR